MVTISSPVRTSVTLRSPCVPCADPLSTKAAYNVVYACVKPHGLRRRGTVIAMSGTTARPGRPTRVAIVGGGAAGAFVAANLLRSGDPAIDVTVIEPRAEIGLGVAYSTPDPWHRLNVPAISMSALVDDPDHFHRWAGIAPEAFARRVDYGRYLQTTLAETVAACIRTAAPRPNGRRAAESRPAPASGSRWPRAMRSRPTPSSWQPGSRRP